MCIAVGKLSFDDWLLLTWSLGWTGSLPPRLPVRISLARPAITSLAFMFDCVPDPVCQMTSGNWLSRSPRATSAAACWIASASCGSSPPMRAFTRAAACLMKPKAWTISRGICSRCPNGKLRDRALGLSAPIGVGGDFDRSEAVAFGAGAGHYFFSRKVHRNDSSSRRRRLRGLWARRSRAPRARRVSSAALAWKVRRTRPPGRGTG